MRAWWDQLAQREQKSVLIGGACVLLLLVYLLLWMPLSSHVDSVSHRVRANQQLVGWMQQTAQTIVALTAVGFSVHRHAPVLLLAVNNALTAAGVSRYLQAPPEVLQRHVILHFTAVPYDSLAVVLGKLWRKDGIVVKTIAVSRLPEPGMVKADVTFWRQQ